MIPKPLIHIVSLTVYISPALLFGGDHESQTKEMIISKKAEVSLACEKTPNLLESILNLTENQPRIPKHVCSERRRQAIDRHQDHLYINLQEPDAQFRSMTDIADSTTSAGQPINNKLTPRSPVGSSKKTDKDSLIILKGYSTKKR